MDNFADQLRSDAQRLDGQLSDALRARIDASLRATTQIATKTPARRRFDFRLMSSLVAGLAAVLAIVSVRLPEPTGAVQAPAGMTADVAGDLTLPANAERLVSPLSTEWQHLQSDLRKAGAAVRSDLGI